MCGTADWEWDPKAGGRQGAYQPVEHFCKGCYAKEQARTHQDPSRNMAGITIELEREGSVESAQREVRRRRMLERDQAKERERQAAEPKLVRA